MKGDNLGREERFAQEINDGGGWGKGLLPFGSEAAVFTGKRCERGQSCHFTHEGRMRGFEGETEMKLCS